MKLKTSKGRTNCAVIAALVLVFVLALTAGLFFRLWPELRQRTPPSHDPAFAMALPIDLASLPTVTRWDYPLGSEHGALAYNAQPFPENRHLGDDLNGIGGENSDLGDPVYAVADGRVLLARDGGPGWGNVVAVLHAIEENGRRRYLQSYYGHLDEMLVEPPQDVRRGQQIGTVGNASGRYWAHLHFEMRDFVTPFVGPGYRDDTRGWINPGEFIPPRRGGAEDDVGRAGAD